MSTNTAFSDLEFRLKTDPYKEGGFYENDYGDFICTSKNFLIEVSRSDDGILYRADDRFYVVNYDDLYTVAEYDEMDYNYGTDILTLGVDDESFSFHIDWHELEEHMLAMGWEYPF